MKNWGHDRVLYDAVRVLRLTRPLVVTSSFTGNLSDGHGQHQVSGEIAQEVFNAAADPKMFPDQIAAGLLPWAPLKVYARVPFARTGEKGIYDWRRAIGSRFATEIMPMAPRLPGCLRRRSASPKASTTQCWGGHSSTWRARGWASSDRRMVASLSRSSGRFLRGIISTALAWASRRQLLKRVSLQASIHRWPGLPATLRKRTKNLAVPAR